MPEHAGCALTQVNSACPCHRLWMDFIDYVREKRFRPSIPCPLAGIRARKPSSWPASRGHFAKAASCRGLNGSRAW